MREDIMIDNVNAMYFSATGTTQTVVTQIANQLSRDIGMKKTARRIDFTLPTARKEQVVFTDRDIVVVGVPVYAGRVPNVLLSFLHSVKGNGAYAIPVVVYGNRNYDDALIELADLLESAGFQVVAGAAFIGEHSFSRSLAQGRPDERDLAIASQFAKQVSEKLNMQGTRQPVTIRGNRPYRAYYMPRRPNGETADIRKVTPKTADNCVDCKLCARVCPMGSIVDDDVTQLHGICIKCGACIKKCPQQAKYYDDDNYLWHKQELETQFAVRREPELFL